MTLTFYLFRTNFADGRGKWEYDVCPYLVDTEKDWDAFVESVQDQWQQEYDWAEHYRGCDVERADRPPKEWLQEKLAKTVAQAAYYRELAEQIQGILQTMKE
jgi:hypothetical protein